MECAVLLAGLALAWHLRGRPPAWALRTLAVVWTVLTLGRYAAVTSTALFGRDINLYWDSRHFSAVAAMLARVASPLEMAGVVLAVLAIPLAVYALLRWAVGRASGAMAHGTVRRAIAGACLLVVGLFAVERLTMQPDATPIMPSPITSTYLRQAGMVADVLLQRDTHSLGDGPSLPAELSAVDGADILLVFVESYGAVTYDRPAFARALEPRRARFEEQVHASGLDVVSAFVESPTFGGSSWLAHVSFLTGVEVKDEGTNVRLMAQKRRTLVTALAGRGYRTVAVMPGLQEYWPEGAFYGFDRIYDTQQLAYTGPSFGWWPIPDQFALAQLEHLELGPKNRAPVFAFLPTTSTHTPFSPTPPYQASWPRMLTSTPYDEAEYQKAWAEPPDWLDMGPELRPFDGVRAGVARRLRRPPAQPRRGARPDRRSPAAGRRERRRRAVGRAGARGVEPGGVPRRAGRARLQARDAPEPRSADAVARVDAGAHVRHGRDARGRRRDRGSGFHSAARVPGPRFLVLGS